MSRYQFVDGGALMDARTWTPVDEADAEYQAWRARGNVPAPSLAASLRTEVWERIKAHRDAVKSSGVKVGQHWYHSDADSRIQQMGLAMMGANLTAGLMWKTMGGQFVPMTPALAGQIFGATAARDAAVFGVAEAHRAALAASADPAGYDWSGGWPESYEGET